MSLKEKREDALAKRLEAMKGRKSGKINPVVESFSAYDDSIVNWEPTIDDTMATKEQVEYLKSQGIDATDYAAGYAELIIKTIRNRSFDGLASPKQLNLLLKYGIKNAESKTKEQASYIIDKISKGWGKKKRKK
jgi:hypothetical protein